MSNPYKIGLAVSALSGAVMVVSSGCAEINASIGAGEPTATTPTSSSRLRAMRKAHIADLPVPEGFRIEESVSEDYATPGWRFVRYTYEGSADTRAVLNFYREQMPLNSWSYISRQSRDGRYTLRFEKPNEVCEVMIESSSGRFGLSEDSKVVVEIKPLRRSGRIKGEDAGQ